MELVPIEPFTAMHEEILDSLASGGFYRCHDPDEPWAPYLWGMIEAGWLEEVHPPPNALVIGAIIKITLAGLNIREILRVRGTL